MSHGESKSRSTLVVSAVMDIDSAEHSEIPKFHMEGEGPKPTEHFPVHTYFLFTLKTTVVIRESAAGRLAFQ